MVLMGARTSGCVQCAQRKSKVLVSTFSSCYISQDFMQKIDKAHTHLLVRTRRRRWCGCVCLLQDKINNSFGWDPIKSVERRYMCEHSRRMDEVLRCMFVCVHFGPKCTSTVLRRCRICIRRRALQHGYGHAETNLYRLCALAFG